MTAWVSFFRDLMTPSRFYADPEGEAGNQCAHALLFGVVVALLVCAAWVASGNGLPYRWAIICAALGPYVVVEVIQAARHGVSNWDSVFDAMFVAHGVAGVVLPCREVAFDGWQIDVRVNFAVLALVILSFLALLLARVAMRIRQKYR